MPWPDFAGAASTGWGSQREAWADGRIAASALGLLNNVGNNIHDYFGAVLL